ncbi:Peptidoglycan-associated lipoprotein [Azospirillaceae bacterium]
MYLKLLSMLFAVVLVSACADDPTSSNKNTGGGGGLTSSIRPGSQEDLAANVGDRVFFEFDRSDLSAEARATLDRQAAWLKNYGSVSFTVEGHCDERGTREYNIGLGNRRAAAVRNYLVARGVSGNRLKTISYGKERPAVLGSGESAWAQNRRGVSVVD